MEEINEIKLPKGVESISVTQHDDKIVIEFMPKEPKFKKGDFVYEDGRIMIIDESSENGITYHALIYPAYDLEVVYNRLYAPSMTLSSLSFRYATEEEKQELIDAMKKDGKRWNAEKLEIEDIPQPKFKVGDSVMIKEGVSSKTHRYTAHSFREDMDKYIGKKLIVEHVFDDVHYGITYTMTNNIYSYAEDWLEPYTEELKKGDLVIFWDNNDNEFASIRMYDRKGYSGHYDSCGALWDSAIKFESKEQFEKILNGKV
jgi:hypothetical protein